MLIVCFSFVCFVFLNNCPAFLDIGLKYELICDFCCIAGVEILSPVVFWSGSPLGRYLHTSGDLTYMKDSEVATYKVAMATYMLQMATLSIRCGRHLVAIATSLLQVATTCNHQNCSWSPLGRHGDREAQVAT